MNRKTQVSLAVAAFAFVSLGSATASLAQQPDKMAQVELRILGTVRTGATGGTSAAAGMKLAAGEAATKGVVGDFSGGLGTGNWPLGSGDQVAWRVTARVVSIGVDSVEVAVSWGRYRPSGAEAPEAGDERTVKLMTGQRHVLDLVQADSQASRLANLVVEVSARQVEDPAYAGASISYEVWFVHEGRDGQKSAKKIDLSGSQGEANSFKFPPLGFTLEGRPAAPEAASPLSLYLNGEVLGRLQRDGIGMLIRNQFGLSCGSGRSGGRGEKEIVARLGETISIEMPKSVGRCTIITADPVPAGARPGVTRVEKGLQVNGNEFFEGEKFSLLVTARRQQ